MIRRAAAALLAATMLAGAAQAQDGRPDGGHGGYHGGGGGHPQGQPRPQGQPAAQPQPTAPHAQPLPGGGQPGGYRGWQGRPGYPGQFQPQPGGQPQFRPGGAGPGGRNRYDGQSQPGQPSVPGGGTPGYRQGQPGQPFVQGQPGSGFRPGAPGQRFGEGGYRPDGRGYPGYNGQPRPVPGGQYRDPRGPGAYADRRDAARDFGRFENRAAWNRGWRSDGRYDYAGWRRNHYQQFRLPAYAAPYGWGYGYRRFGVGAFLFDGLFAEDYWIDDPYDYRLPPAYGPYRWVRYYGDALLVDVDTGEVVDVVYGIFA